MDIARDLARWLFWAALRFERAYIAVELACTIQKRLALVNGAACSELLSARAMVDIAGRVILKVAAREGAVIPLRLIKHRNMWRDAFLLNQPVQHRSCPVSGIPDKPLRLEAEALLCSLDHGLRRADLGLANRAGGLDVNDDTELHVDEIVVGISEECRSLVSAGPLRRGIGWRDELRHNVAGSAPRCVVEGRQILLHRAAGPRRIAIPAPILTCDRALLVGICLDQARIDCKAFAADQTGCDARLDDPLEHVAENISIAEALVAGARERRMIRDSILDPELAEPAIGQVHLHFTADQPLRTDRKDISYHQHPDHQFRIDRRTAHGRIMRCKFIAKPGQIESGVDLPHQMIFGNGVAKVKLVEQLTLVTLQMAHHGSTSPRIASTQRNHASRSVSTDFCNKIGTSRTCCDVRPKSAIRTKTDV